MAAGDSGGERPGSTVGMRAPELIIFVSPVLGGAFVGLSDAGDQGGAAAERAGDFVTLVAGDHGAADADNMGECCLCDGNELERCSLDVCAERMGTPASVKPNPSLSTAAGGSIVSMAAGGSIPWSRS